MRSLQISLCVLLTVIMIACSSITTNSPTSSPTLSNKEKIIGTWEFVKSTGGDPKDPAPPPGSTVEFTKDGKAKMTVKAGGQPVTVDATYTVDGDTLKLVMKGPPGGKDITDTMTITKLTDKELITEEKKGGKTETTELKKK
jgi:uncharacterized protein (TIGR03066 family)